MKSFKKRLAGGEILLGTIVSLPSPEIAEILAGLGFDWLFIDAEHGAMDSSDVQRILQAAGAGCPALVRVPLNDEIWIKKALDSGAQGVIVPQVNSASEAARAVSFAKYPPMGGRSVGISRAHGYGGRFQEYVRQANRETLVIVQAEHADAVNNIDAMLDVQGIDGVFVGPYDLSASMGKPGAVDDPEVAGAIDRIRQAARRARMPLGIFGADEGSVSSRIRSGFSLICVASDTLLLRRAAAETLERLRRG